MWADNKTSEDLLGFKVRADLLIYMFQSINPTCRQVIKLIIYSLSSIVLTQNLENQVNNLFLKTSRFLRMILQNSIFQIFHFHRR